MFNLQNIKIVLIVSLCFVLFVPCIRVRKKEGNVLFNDALNAFYLWLYGIKHMVKNHSDIERENPLPPHGLLFPISSKVLLQGYPTDRITHTTAFVTPVVEHWLERESTHRQDNT